MVYSTKMLKILQIKLRYRRCDKCGHTKKTVEK